MPPSFFWRLEVEFQRDAGFTPVGRGGGGGDAALGRRVLTELNLIKAENSRHGMEFQALILEFR
jgi:hypothetical protein